MFHIKMNDDRRVQTQIEIYEIHNFNVYEAAPLTLWCVFKN